ncbi:MAG: hypothetical protein FWG03_08070 [Clostridiales bacterium]|nr:hypothetical protein [Clostridiales bacterium]
MMQGLILALALSLGLTLALEAGFFLLLGQFRNAGGLFFFAQRPHGEAGSLHRGKGSTHRGKGPTYYAKDLLLVVLVNVITNPVVVLLYWLAAAYTEWNAIIILIPLELFAVLFEGCYYKKYGKGFKRPYLFSAAANMFSFWMGMLIQSII